MRALIVFVLLSAAPYGFGQQPPADRQAGTAPAAQPPATQSAHRSVVGVKPGEEAIKNKDLYETTGTFHPFRRMPRFILSDQKEIWTRPFHINKRTAKYWAAFGGATVILFTLDERIQQHAPNPPWLVTLGTRGSNLGASYTLIPMAAAFYFLGSKAHSQRFREAGLLGFEALADATILEETLKIVTDRERPLEGNGEGRFFNSPNRWNAGFPSGHSINTFALASVFAHEYHDKWWVQALAYGYATTVALSRLAANRHFPSDTLAGGAMGWFIGDYVYAKRHNPNVGKPGLTTRILDHVHFGFSMN